MMSSDGAAAALPRQMRDKIQQYQHFIENVLKRDLAACTKQMERVQQKHTDYSSLRQSLSAMQAQHATERASKPDAHIAPMKSMVNLGSEFYVKAVVPDPTRVFIDVGLGFHVELTLSEAVSWIDAKLPTLDSQVQTTKSQAAMIQGKIKVVYEGIAEIMQLQQAQKPQRQFF